MLKLDKDDIAELKRNGASMAGINGWEEQKPGGGGQNNRYKKYENQTVIIVGYSKKNSPQYIYLMPKVMDALGNPKTIKIYARGFNVAFVNAGDGGGYKVNTTTSLGGGKTSKVTPHISAMNFLRKWNIRSGVYNCHFETGMIVFDVNQLPSEL